MSPLCDRGVPQRPALTFQEYRTQFRVHALPTIVYWCTYATIGMAIAILGPILPMLKCKTDASMVAMSWIVFCQFGITPLATLLAAPLLQRVPANAVHLIASAILPICTLIMSIVTSEILLAINMAMLGIQVGVLENLANTQMVVIHGNSIAPFLQAMYFLYGCGALLSQVIVDPFLGNLSKNCSAKMWQENKVPVDSQTPFWIITFLQALQCVLVICLVFKHGFGPYGDFSNCLSDDDGTPDVVDVPNHVDHNDGTENGPDKVTKASPPIWTVERIKLLFKGITFSARAVLILTAAIICALLDGIQSEYSSFITAYMNTFAKFDTHSATYVGMMFWGFFCFGRFLAAIASLRLHVFSILVLDMSGLFIGALFILCGYTSPLMIYLGSGLFGLALSNTTPSMIALTQDFVSLHRWSTTVLIVFAAAGEALTPLLAGNLVGEKGDKEATGYAFPLFNAALVLLVMTLFFLFYVFGSHWRLQTVKYVGGNGSIEGDEFNLTTYHRLQSSQSSQVDGPLSSNQY